MLLCIVAPHVHKHHNKHPRVSLKSARPRGLVELRKLKAGSMMIVHIMSSCAPQAIACKSTLFFLRVYRYPCRRKTDTTSQLLPPPPSCFWEVNKIGGAQCTLIFLGGSWDPCFVFECLLCFGLFCHSPGLLLLLFTFPVNQHSWNVEHLTLSILYIYNYMMAIPGAISLKKNINKNTYPHRDKVVQTIFVYRCNRVYTNCFCISCLWMLSRNVKGAIHQGYVFFNPEVSL